MSAPGGFRAQIRVRLITSTSILILEAQPVEQDRLVDNRIHHPPVASPALRTSAKNFASVPPVKRIVSSNQVSRPVLLLLVRCVYICKQLENGDLLRLGLARNGTPIGPHCFCGIRAWMASRSPSIGLPASQFAVKFKAANGIEGHRPQKRSLHERAWSVAGGMISHPRTLEPEFMYLPLERFTVDYLAAASSGIV